MQAFVYTHQVAILVFNRCPFKALIVLQICHCSGYRISMAAISLEFVQLHIYGVTMHANPRTLEISNLVLKFSETALQF